MDTNMGDDITLNDILQRNFKRQSWDPWLPNSYLCADEQPVQPLAHDPNAQESMTQIMQMQNYLRNNQNPEDLYVSTMKQCPCEWRYCKISIDAQKMAGELFYS